MRSHRSSNLDPLEPRISRFISDRKMYVLRDNKGNALNSSYTPEGLL